MLDQSFGYDTPSFARRKVYAFDTPEMFAVYRELMDIAKEIETCRASI